MAGDRGDLKAHQETYNRVFMNLVKWGSVLAVITTLIVFAFTDGR
jgi:hypothetical protein